MHPLEAAGRIPKLTAVGASGTPIHAMANVKTAAARAAAGVVPTAGRVTPFQPLLYNGGPVMLPYVAAYDIFWAPSTLQDGGATSYSANYGTPTILLSAWLQGHEPFNIATQYFQTVGSTTTYINNGGGLGGFVVDSGAYPAHGTGCGSRTDCYDDTQAQAKIKAVMTAQGWTGGMNKIFILFSSSNEISCFASGNICSDNIYCAYHGSFSFGGQNVIYAIIPYYTPSGCQAGGQTTPNDPNGDLAASGMSHEMTEAATDPLLNAWFDSGGSEIGDLCNFMFGTNTWGSGATAGNQFWNGFTFEIQQEYDNHAGACAQAGPQ